MSKKIRERTHVEEKRVVSMKKKSREPVYTRRKAVAIVHGRQGILLVAGKRGIFTLPGGGALKGEPRKEACIRELREETGLYTKKAQYLFSYLGRKWRARSGNLVRNEVQVFEVTAYGQARARNEIQTIAHWKKGSRHKISKRTKETIENYYVCKKKSFRKAK